MHPRESYDETLNRLPDMAYDPEKGHQNVWQAPPMHRDGEFSRFSRYPEPGDTRLCDALPPRRGDTRQRRRSWRRARERDRSRDPRGVRDKSDEKKGPSQTFLIKTSPEEMGEPVRRSMKR